MSSPDERLASLERQVENLIREVAELRAAARPAAAPGPAPAPEPATRAQEAGAPFLDPRIAAALGSRQRQEKRAGPVPPTFGEQLNARVDGEALESFVGRYVLVALAALIILMGVGAVIKMAVEKGMLTPEVRIVAGILSAIAIAGAGLFFRRRGDVRYGGALLALALAVVDLVAWGAGPHFHLVSMPVALAVIDAVAILLAALALHDESEFLFVVATGGALSAPFVASEGGGTATSLLLYGFTVLAAGLRAARDPAWWRAFAVLVLGALAFELAAAALPAGEGWYAPYALTIFPAACAAAALLFGAAAWSSELPRAFVAMGLVALIEGWDPFHHAGIVPVGVVASSVALVTYIALSVRDVPARLWTTSAIVLPFLSLGVVYAAATGTLVEGGVIALWTLFALGAREFERARSAAHREGAHQFASSILGALAITAWLWERPLPLVAALAAWGVFQAALGRGSSSALPVLGAAIPLAASSLSAFDQLLSRDAYSYVPFTTRSSASALAAAAGIGLAGLVISRDDGRAKEVASRATRIGVLVAFVIVWGRMELAYAFSRDVAGFLLSTYYAACGVASIVAGRRLAIARLRIAGLGLSVYAAFKAVVEVTNITSVWWRVAAYAAVGVFLLAAGYLYREKVRPVPEGGLAG